MLFMFCDGMFLEILWMLIIEMNFVYIRFWFVGFDSMFVVVWVVRLICKVWLRRLVKRVVGVFLVCNIWVGWLWNDFLMWWMSFLDMFFSVLRMGLGIICNVRFEIICIMCWYKIKLYFLIYGVMVGCEKSFWMGMVRVFWNEVKRWKNVFFL